MSSQWIFEPNEDQRLDTEVAKEGFNTLTEQINEEAGRSLTPEQVTAGFLHVASEGICRPIRSLTERKGCDISSHNLFVSGGAGGQHACDHPHGMASADVVQESRVLAKGNYNGKTLPKLKARVKQWKAKVRQQ
ncbi:hypothetical protein KEM54_000257 [Ascosphaera aggregata]|nr:hypothetical protein KEM54_000257 [Ascosphaera aggregata]